MSNKSSLIISLIVFFFAASCLISGSNILLYALLTEPYLPAGTLITWVGMVALPASLYFGFHFLNKPVSPIEKIFSVCIKISMLVSALWAPISALLSGNLSNSFTGKPQFQGGQLAMKIFWSYSYFVVILPLGILFAIGLYSLFKRFFSHSKKTGSL